MDMALVCAGKLKEDDWRRAEEYFRNKLNKKQSFIICEVPDEKIPVNAGRKEEDKVKEKEGQAMLPYIKQGDYVIALCIDGKREDNEGLRKKLREVSEDGRYKRTVFVIGGSLGLSPEVIRRANLRLSFSDMTFPHGLMRIMLLEVICGM